jgi:hypothetical protein
MLKLVILVTGRKLSSITTFFIYKVSREFRIQEGPVWLEILIQQPIEFPTAVTHKSLTIWSCLIDHWKAKRVSYQFSIQDFRSFGKSKAHKLRSILSLFCPETEFSSNVDR